jgi:hypothetical protein
MHQDNNGRATREIIILWFCKENNKLRDRKKNIYSTGFKKIFTLHIPHGAPYIYDFIVLTSLTHSRKIILVVLQIGK